MQKKILFPSIYIVLAVIAVVFGVDGLLMIITAPIGLLLIAIDIVFRIRITSVWPPLFIGAVFWFFVGWLTDSLLRRIREPSHKV